MHFLFIHFVPFLLNNEYSFTGKNFKHQRCETTRLHFHVFQVKRAKIASREESRQAGGNFRARSRGSLALLSLKVAGTSFLAWGAGLTIVRHARKTRDKERLKSKQIWRPTHYLAWSSWPHSIVCIFLGSTATLTTTVTKFT